MATEPIDTWTPPTNDTYVTVIMVTAGLEAFFNETGPLADLEVRVRQERQLTPAPHLAAFVAACRDAVESQATLATRFQLAAAALTGEQVDRGAEQFQDVARLVSLRDWLVRSERSPPSEVTQYLQEQGLTRPIVDGDPEVQTSATSHIATAQVASWAYAAAYRTVDSTLALFPPDTIGFSFLTMVRRTAED